jgi:hypothetical protein
MVQESVRLYGFTREELLEWVYLCEESPSGLRWRVSSSSTAVKGQVAGSFSETVKFPCWRVKIDKTAMIVARVVWFLNTGEIPDKVDHKNGNPRENSFGNLRNVKIKVNCENRVVLNPNGVPGVYLTEDKYGNPLWRCQGTNYSGKRWSKVFACKKFGFDGAKKLAIEYRLVKDSENNVQTRERTLNDT